MSFAGKAAWTVVFGYGMLGAAKKEKPAVCSNTGLAEYFLLNWNAKANPRKVNA